MMRRRTFIRKALAVAVALPIFGPQLRGQNIQAATVSIGRVGCDGSGWTPLGIAHRVSVEIRGPSGDFVPLPVSASPQQIADNLLGRYARPVVRLQIDGNEISKQMVERLRAAHFKKAG